MKRLTYLMVFMVLFLALMVACTSETTNPTAEPELAATSTLPAATSTLPAATSTESPLPPTETAAVPPTETAAIPPTAPIETETPSSPVAEDGLCTDVQRPAIGLSVPDKGILITNPQTGQSCYTTLGGDNPGSFQATQDAVFYSLRQGDQFVVKRFNEDGTAALLPFTAVNVDDTLQNYGFVVADDGSQIAWSLSTAGADFDDPLVSTLWVAGINGEDVVTPLPEFQPAPGSRRALVPVRFSADNSTLFYTLQPIGIGGSWASFTGRYDNLYALRLRSEAPPELIYDCTAGGQAILCIGDFFEFEGQVGMLAYVDGQSVVIINGAGEILNTIPLDDDYVGYPTISAEGDLVFYGAVLPADTDTNALIEMGTVYRVAPPTAAHEILAASTGLLYPFDWLDSTQVVVGYTSGEFNWGTAVVGLDGSLQIIQSEPNANFMDVLP